jgi:membrane protein
MPVHRDDDETRPHDRDHRDASVLSAMVPKLTGIAPATWAYAAKRTVREFLDDDCITLAAALTFYALLSIFPALLALVSTLSLFGQSDRVVAVFLDIINTLATPSVVDVIEGFLSQLTEFSGAGFAFAVGIAGALWTASIYVNAFAKAMNRIYEVEEGRPIWVLRPIMIGITLAMLLIALIVAIILVASGPVAEAIGSALGLTDTVLAVWNVGRWPMLAVVAVVLVAVLYNATPNVRQPKRRWLSPGGLLALIGLSLASLGFFFYVSNFGNYNATYGSLGGIIVLLLWLWIANLALLFGAEFDAELERGRQLQGGIAAEEHIQLRRRDTRQIEKTREQEEKLIQGGRELRERHGNDEGAHPEG